MYRLFRPKKQPPAKRGRGSVPWTAWEVTLIVVSLLLIVFPLYAEAYRWVNPRSVPAALRQQEISPTPDPSAPTPGEAAPDPSESTPAPSEPPTAEPPTVPVEPPPGVPSPELQQRATQTPTGTQLATTPTETTVPDTPTNTPSGPSATPTLTLTPGGPSVTPSFTPSPTNTSTGPSATPTLTLTPGGPTFTPSPTTIITEPPLAVVKVASASLVSIGDQFSFSISVFSTSATPRTVQVIDTLDTQLEFVSASTSSGTCSNSGGTVTCSGISVQNNAPATITINVRVSAIATPGGRIRNMASAQDDLSNTAPSDEVFVDISSVVVPPTVTTGPSTPTNTTGPGTPTNTTVPPTVGPNTPTATPVVVPPTVPPATSPPATSPPQPEPPDPPEPPGDEEDTPVPQPPPTTPPQPPLPPTPRPGQPASTARPTPRRTPVPQAPRTVTPGTQTAATQTAQSVTNTPGLPTPEAGLFFRMNSDWGSAFAGQEVIYAIAVRNTRASGALLNVQITTDLPANLEILEDSADRGDPTVVGNQVKLTLDALQPSEGVEIAIKTRIKPTVANGTRIISQAELTFDGLEFPAHSNIVTVLVVAPAQIQAQPQIGAGPQQQATAVVTPTATATPTQTTAPTTTATATATPTQTTAPTATAVAGTRPPGAPLPNTSTGVPIFGFALLGMTMMVRTVRVHRAQSRI